VSGIVVGVDGSDESLHALRWALEEARSRGAKLTVIYAWVYPHLPPPGFAPPVQVDMGGLQLGAEALLDAAVSEVVGPDAGVECERAAVQGTAAAVLVEAAEDADLLVVGSRGLGGFTGLLLGSVSQQCAHHAPCPVVIVRRSRPDAGDTERR
jgi:nucleotide-binding universal stress UspA family protein